MVGKRLWSAYLGITLVGLLLLLSSAVMASGMAEDDHTATADELHLSVAPPTPGNEERADEQHHPPHDMHGDDTGDHPSEVTAHARRYPTSDLNGNTLLVGFAAVNLLVLSAAKLAAQRRGEAP